MNTDTIKVTPSQLATALDFAVDNAQPLYIWGAPGIGKSDIVNAALNRRFSVVENFYALLHDPTDIKGFGVPDRAEGVMRWLKPEFFAHDVPVGFFVDELSSAPMLVKNSLLQLALQPEAFLPGGSYVVAAGNRPQDRTGASALPAALANRFVHLRLVASVDDWTRWALADGTIAPVVIAYARFQPDAIEGEPDLSQTAYCTPRSLAKIGKLIRAGMPASIETQLICGAIGDVHGTQLAEFVRTWRSMPSLDAIIDSPHSAAVPADRGVIFALIHGLALKAKAANFDSIVAYAQRLPAEFTTALVADCVARDASLQNTAAYVRYAVKAAA